MAKKYDDFDEADQDGVFDQIFGIISNRKREFAVVSVLAAVVLLGFVVLGGYPDDEQTAQSESVPIVRADAGSYKTTPENPGGMEIPYRDSTVFSSVEGQKTEGATENILADETTEQPLPKEELFAGLKTEEAPAQTPPVPAVAEQPPMPLPETLAKVEPVAPPAIPSSNESLVKEAIGVPAEKVADVAKVEVPPAKIEEQKADKADAADKAAKIESAAGAASASKAIQPGGYYVQLASVRSESGAAAEFKKMQAKYSGLSTLTFRTQEANLGAKGVFYRIQAGPMSKDSAASVCGDIKKAGGSCLVVGK